MKKLIILCTVPVVVFLFVSCKKDSNNNNPGTQTFSYKAGGGTTVTADSANAVLYTLGIAPFVRMIDVFAYKGGIEVMEFHFQPKTGSFTADGTFTNAWLTHKTGITYPDDYYNSTSGVLNITLCDTVAKKIEGAFNFTGNNGSADKTITDGVMKVNITRVQ